MLTVQEVKEALPETLRGNATQEFVDKLNNICSDPVVAEEMRNNFISYARVLQNGRFKVKDYLNAIKYVSYKMMEMTNEEAYELTHPDRYAKLIARGADDREISAYVAMYNKNGLVNKIMEQIMIPTHVLNAPLHQQAINRLGELMMTAKSEKVQADAAIALMNGLKKPEKTSIEIDIGIKENSVIEAMQRNMALLAERQLQIINENRGITAAQLVAQPLIEAKPVLEGEYVEIETDTSGS